jgi:hypothetical protein
MHQRLSLRLTTRSVVTTTAIALALWAPAPTRAADAIRVDAGAVEVSPGDRQCSLIEAIRNAEAAAELSGGDCRPGDRGMDTIVLAPDALYVLKQDYLTATGIQPPPPVPSPGPFRAYFPIALNSDGRDTDSGLPPIQSPIVIEGQHATIERSAAPGTPPMRIFAVDGGVLTLADVTLRGGAIDASFANGSAGRGGAIRITSGTLMLQDANVMANRAAEGGGISIEGGSSQVEIVRSFIHGNEAPGGLGGGIAVVNSASLVVGDSFITANDAEDGGGIGIDYGITVTIMGSTVRGNTAREHGGGVHSRGGRFRVIASEISHNRAETGGGLHADGRTEIEDSAIRANQAVVAAGVLVGIESELTLAHSIVEDNIAGYREAGVVMLDYTQATITDSTIRNNVAVDGPCGGLCSSNGDVRIRRSAITGNRGGGIINGYGKMTIEASTISGNFNGPEGGNGIFNQGPLELRWSTVAANHGAGEDNVGSAVMSFDADGHLRMIGSIITGHILGQDCTGDDIVSEGWNLASDATCPLKARGDRPSTDPRLGPLADNGGPTWTHALLDGSPAISAIARGEAGCGGSGTVDQRGVPRPRGERCDIGAFER